MKSKYAYVHKDGSGFDKHGLWQHAGQLFLISHIDKDLKFSVWEEYVIKRFYKIALKKTCSYQQAVILSMYTIQNALELREIDIYTQIFPKGGQS